MNIQKVFNALEADMNSSALGIICAELESQGYSVSIDGTPVTSDGFFSEDFSEIEAMMGPINLCLLRNRKVEQEFSIEFRDFHEVIFLKNIV